MMPNMASPDQLVSGAVASCKFSSEFEKRISDSSRTMGWTVVVASRQRLVQASPEHGRQV
jgi:hypothetical protein